ncbi:hypothetical protein B0H63DRAFT_448942 [Podospora didyma]|uniref:BZIP domain-containing protein n=1 Tax=Podospora didyma TaxID=330526 RepID=A0AAE0NNW3_9PEZI|nr:hypothetical protein B0H63DRAFT_448942 [Podospora didyma]
MNNSELDPELDPGYEVLPDGEFAAFDLDGDFDSFSTSPLTSPPLPSNYFGGWDPYYASPTQAELLEATSPSSCPPHPHLPANGVPLDTIAVQELPSYFPFVPPPNQQLALYDGHLLDNASNPHHSIPCCETQSSPTWWPDATDNGFAMSETARPGPAREQRTHSRRHTQPEILATTIKGWAAGGKEKRQPATLIPAPSAASPVVPDSSVRRLAPKEPKAASKPAPRQRRSSSSSTKMKTHPPLAIAIPSSNLLSQYPVVEEDEINGADRSSVPSILTASLSSGAPTSTTFPSPITPYSVPSASAPATTLIPPAGSRARNRIAANKCRAKTKANVSRLEEEETHARSKQAELIGTLTELKEEAYNLKEQLFKHVNCNCTMIQEYLHVSARRIVSRAIRDAAELEEDDEEEESEEESEEEGEEEKEEG